MARKTIASLEDELDRVKRQRDQLAEDIIKMRSSKDTLLKKIKNFEVTIEMMKDHIGWLASQKNRLVGFIEGKESMFNDKVEVEDTRVQYPKQLISRQERFMDECKAEFISQDDNHLTLRTDPLRRY